MTSTNRHRARGYTMLHTFVYLIIYGAVITAGAKIIQRNARMEQRVAGWANDDGVVQSLMTRLAEDLAAAGEARVDGDDGGALVLATDNGTVRYRQVGRDVTRVAEPADGPTVRSAWALKRSEVAWVVEPVTDATAVVWMHVVVTDRVERESSVVRYEYAKALRVGGGGRSAAGVQR
jgi:hypothetical protein